MWILGVLSGTVRLHECDTNGVNNLAFSVFVGKSLLAAFITGDSIDAVGALCIVNKNVNFILIIECFVNVSNCGAKLLEVKKELAVTEQESVLLSWAVLDHLRWLINKDWM